MSAAPLFRQATKRQAKLRLAIDGPSGAGKTWTSLSIASRLGTRTAVIDTERGSASLYSDTYHFDVAEMSPPFEPHIAVETIRQAERAGYDVLVIDSLSHFWEGEGGVRDMVDAASERAHGNTFAGWKVGTPAYRHLVDTILAADMHILVTMRSKTEWVLETNERGKQVPRRVGMAPVMRGGIEYEFTVVVDPDLSHQAIVTKSRCAEIADRLYPAHREADLAESLKTWLAAGVEPAGVDTRGRIVELLGSIADPDARMRAKAAFVAEFGHPDHLTADRSAAAVAWVEDVAGVGPVAARRAPATAEMPADVVAAPEPGDDDDYTPADPPPAAGELDGFGAPAAADSCVSARWCTSVRRKLGPIAEHGDAVLAVLRFACNRPVSGLPAVRLDEADAVAEAVRSIAAGTLRVGGSDEGWTVTHCTSPAPASSDDGDAPF